MKSLRFRTRASRGYFPVSRTPSAEPSAAVNFRSDYFLYTDEERRLRPFLRRRPIRLVPFAVRIRLRKPCLRLRRRFDG